MEMPSQLRAAVERYCERVPLHTVQAAASELSRRYREGQSRRPFVAGEQDVRAYLAVRLPATFAAIQAVFSELAKRCPDFAPASLLDVGSGPGTALWAAAAIWPSLHRATALERSGPFRTCGQTLAAAASESVVAAARWQNADLAGEWESESADLVSACYVLGELAAPVRERTVARLWERSSIALVLVEPGTVEGYRRILAARTQLLALGATLAAPCPHTGPCPIVADDWCHFAERVGRSRLHRLAKGAALAYEDEKFAYIVAVRAGASLASSRVLRHPQYAPGQVDLTLCTPAGLVRRKVTAREKEHFKRARKLKWGDAY